MQTYKINKIHGPHICGIGSHAGLPIVKIDISDDGKYSGGSCMTAFEVLDKVNEIRGNVRTVVIGGGEPTDYIDFNFIMALKNSKLDVHLYTNGKKPIKFLSGIIDHVSVLVQQSPEETHIEMCDDLLIPYPYLDDSVTPRAFLGEGFDFKCGYIMPMRRELYVNIIRASEEIISSCPDWRLCYRMHKIVETI